MRIKQCWMSPTVQDAFGFFLKKYGLKPYSDRNKPAIFFGCYYTEPEKIKRHSSTIVLVWRGSDILQPGHLQLAKKRKNIKHVAISSFIADDLLRADIKYKFLPVIGTDTSSFKPCPLGDEIYTYIPSTRLDFYGNDIVHKVQKKCKYKINITNGSGQLSRFALLDVYKRCFCGLRFTPHDGIANMVMEMGLMGRKCLYNGKVPNAIPWDNSNVDEIVESIEREAQNIGTTNFDVASKVSDFLEIGNDWITEEYWR